MSNQATTELDLFIELIKRFPVLDAVHGESLDREELGERLDVSTATTYRLTGWLDKRGLTAESDGAFTLTALGEVLTDVISTFEAEVRTTLEPASSTPDLLIDLIRHSSMLDALQGGSLDRREL